MGWIEQYQSKLTTADDALAVLKSGDRVYIHQGCSQPDALIDAMIRRAGEVRDVEVVHLATMGPAPYAAPEFEGIFRHNAFFIGGNVRRAVQEGRADYIPIFLHEIEGLFLSGVMPIDIALIQCTPPDDYGYMSLGTGIDVSLTAAKHARRLVVEINDQAPRTMGDSFIHVTKADALVEASHPLSEYKKQGITDVHRAIARYVAELIPDGATLQTGIGGIPDAVLMNLTGHKDLGVHTEMFSDGVIPLIQSGVINNERKTLHPHKVISGFVLGTRPLFDFIHDNPIFEFHPTAYTNDPFVIARNERMVTINSALEVDLTGQVCADSIGTKHFSGVGGQMDFIRGASYSRGGKPIIALTSRTRKGIPRIVPALRSGAGVVSTRANVHYVITEFGIAYIYGQSMKERARRLINIAHPDDRDMLEKAAFERWNGHWSMEPY